MNGNSNGRPNLPSFGLVFFFTRWNLLQCPVLLYYALLPGGKFLSKQTDESISREITKELRAMSKNQIGSVSMINLFLPAPPFREGWAGENMVYLQKEQIPIMKRMGGKLLWIFLLSFVQQILWHKDVKLKSPACWNALTLLFSPVGCAQMSLFPISPFPSLWALYLWSSTCCLTNYCSTWIGKTGSLIKDFNEQR